MTVSLSWPAALPLPSIQGYQLTRKPYVSRTNMDIGPARQRRRSTETLAELTVQLELTSWEQMLFDAWCELRAQNGAQWFNITLLGGRGLETYEARIKAGVDQSDKPRNGERWICTFTLETRSRPMLTSAELDMLLLEDRTEIMTDLPAIHAALVATSSP
ncbi:MAG TPA: hypothetical protein VFB13_00710 [Reyranella sp.]|jgi:hypothetical protein|nr:hypothetical protein [Reyranella sp.]